MKNNILAIGVLCLVIVCFGLAACHSGGGSGDTPSTGIQAIIAGGDSSSINRCIYELPGSMWYFGDGSITGSVTLDYEGKVESATQSDCKKNFRR